MPSINTVLSMVTRLRDSMTNATLQGNTFNGRKQLVRTTDDGKLPALDGSLLTGISAGTSYVSFIAQDNINPFNVVTADGFIANSATISQRNKIIGLAISSTLIGFSGDVIGAGEVTNPAWSWAIGDKIYLNGTTLSTIAPSSGYLQFIGIATSSNTIDVKLNESILL